MNYDHVEIGNNVIIGFRSVLLPGCVIGDDVVVGAQSVVPGGYISDGLIVGGNPARIIRQIRPLDNVDSEIMVMLALIRMYIKSCTYRNIQSNFREVKYPIILFGNCCLNVETRSVDGKEDDYTDDLRDFLFKNGIRIYTKRPFRKLGMVNKS